MSFLLHPTLEHAITDHSIMLMEMLSSAVLWGLGDVIAQLIERRSKPHKRFPKWWRIFKLASFAVLWAWATHFELEILYFFFPEESIKARLYRVAADQIIYSTLVYGALFWYTAWLDGLTFREQMGRVRLLLWPTLLQSWIVWPAVELFNFSFVAPEYQMVLSSFVNVPWSAFLAYRAALMEKEADTLASPKPNDKEREKLISIQKERERDNEKERQSDYESDAVRSKLFSPAEQRRRGEKTIDMVEEDGNELETVEMSGFNTETEQE